MKCFRRLLPVIGLLLPMAFASAQQAPVAVDDLLRVVAGSTNTFDYLHLNDTDADGDTLAMTPINGVEFIPMPGFSGTTNFTYVVTDGTLQSTGTATVAVNTPINAEAARDQILAGVTHIASGVSPGKLVVFGPTAYAVNWFDGEGEYDPMVGVASWGSGKVIAQPDHQMLNVDNYGGQGDTAQFVFNGLAWLSGTTNRNISIITYDSDHRDWFETQGYSNVVVASESSLTNDLPGADVFFAAWLGSKEPDHNLEAIGDFVTVGGGLFMCDYGNGYEDYWWNHTLRYNAPGNRLLREAGIGFCNGGHGGSGAIVATNRSTAKLEFDTALAMLEDSAGYTDAELEQGGELLARVSQVVPDNDILLARRNVVFFDRVEQINPTPATPISDPFEQSLLSQESEILAATPPADVVAHRTAEAVYGTIPTTAPRVTDTVAINGNRSRWQATGFYAVPGELVTVTLPSALVGQGYRIRINAHRDNISARNTWERMPSVHRDYEITGTTSQVANAFGGAIFIDFRGGGFEAAPPAHGMVNITVSGAVRHPWFDLDRHADTDWNSNLRDQPGTYGVLVSSNHVVVLPKHQIEEANLTEPTRLMTWWNQVVQSEDDLAGYTLQRTGAEVANVDVQISAGAAHSGFPFQAYEKHWGNLADVARLTTLGSWGDFHELGHNHQRSWWKFNDGDTEVTCNVFSTFCLRTLASAPSPGGWGWTVDPAAVIQKATSAVQATNYLGTSSLSDRLSFWVQLADSFGWDAYKQVLGSYEQDNATNPGNLPSGDQEDMEQWLVRFSTEVGYDLSGFMVDTWGLPIGTAVVAQVSHLPDWMPVIGGMPDQATAVNKAHTLDYSTFSYSMDGTADVVNVSAPAHGMLIDHGNGTWTYEPDYNFVGTETFVYTLRSSAGNTQDFTNTVSVLAQGAYKETWLNIGGNSISDLTGSPNYPDNPDESEVVDSLQLPINAGSGYGVRLRALLLPPTTGSYTFWTASDDNSEIWLSTDTNAANIAAIADVNGWTDPLEWTKFASQQSVPIPLVAAQKYYMEVFQKEGSGGDHLAIAWEVPGTTSTNVITSEYLELPPGVYPEVDNARTWVGRNGLSGDDLDVDADPDGDGHTNQQEFNTRTNPNDVNDVLSLGIDNDGLDFEAVSGKTYRVEFRNGFGDTNGWQFLSEFVATQQVVEVSDPSTSNPPVRVYRLLANP